MIDNGLVECYVTVRVLGVGQAVTAISLAVLVGICVRWIKQVQLAQSRESWGDAQSRQEGR